MTPEILEYLLRLTVIWAVLLAYYFVALRRAGFATQRFYLLGTLVFGLMVPLLPALGGGLPMVGLPSVSYVAEPYFYTGTAAAEASDFERSWSVVLPWLYLMGVGFFAARTLVQWKGLWQWRSSGRPDLYEGYRVVRHRGITGPFVAFGCIFLPDGMTDAELENTALIHEASHLRLRHHYDTLLLTLGSLLLWFHPLFWMIRRLLATVHEYEADAAVIQRVPVRTYGLQLLHASLGPRGYPGLFSSPIKKRITMITDKTRTQKLRLFPLIALSLLLAGLVVACSDAGEDILQEEYTQVPLLGLSPTDEVSEYPRLKSGDANLNAPEALVSAIYNEIHYPKKALTSGLIGRARATLVIDPEGKVLGISMFRELPVAEDENEDNNLTIIGFSPTDKFSVATGSSVFLDEVSRTFEVLGDFEPATKDGKPIAVQLEIDFNFKLEE